MIKNGIQNSITFTDKGPRKGWRTPLNIINDSEQRDEEKEGSRGPFASERGDEPRSGMPNGSTYLYTYFGARYMDHELTTMWLSVDPMADKYPGISPYAYCAWNPVKLVDPEGMDVWEISKNGSLRWMYESEKDTIKAPDGSFVEVSDGVLFRGSDGRRGRDYSQEYGHYGLSFNSNKENAFEVFEFLADHSEIEYSLFEVDNGLYSTFMLTTSFQEKGDSWGCKRAQDYLNNNQLITHVHSHPSGSLQPSFNKDVPSFTDTQVNAYIYCPKDKNVSRNLKYGGYNRYHSSDKLKGTDKISTSKMTISEHGKKYKYKS